MLASRKSAAACEMSRDDQRLARSDDAAEDGLLDLEDDLRPRPRAALLLVHPRGVGLELLAVLGEQREPDAIARHEPGDPRRERLEGERARPTERAMISSIAFCVCSCSISPSVAWWVCSCPRSAAPAIRSGAWPATARISITDPRRDRPGRARRGRRGMPPATDPGDRLDHAEAGRSRPQMTQTGARRSAVAHVRCGGRHLVGRRRPAAAAGRTTRDAASRRGRAPGACAPSTLYTPRATFPCPPRCRRSDRRGRPSRACTR